LLDEEQAQGADALALKQQLPADAPQVPGEEHGGESKDDGEGVDVGQEVDELTPLDLAYGKPSQEDTQGGRKEAIEGQHEVCADAAAFGHSHRRGRKDGARTS